MAKSKKTKTSVFDTTFSASDFRTLAATTGTFDISNVTGSTRVGGSVSYPASAELTISEVSATITNISAVDVSASFGNSLVISWDDPGTLFAGVSGVTFDVVHSIADNGEAGGIASGKVQITLDDGLSGDTVLTSSTFELSSFGDARMEVFAPQSVEWRGRMINEGLI